MKLRNKKTGEAVYVDFRIPLCNNDETLGSYSVTSLEALNRSFEDYEPKEPLIKDKKIRKAVRAWAEACCIETIEITHSRKCILRAISAITGDDEICIDREIGQILDERVYNIDELCGEEE